MSPLDAIVLHRLEGGVRLSLARLAEDCRTGRVEDTAAHWVDMLAGHLDGLRLTFPPATDPGQSNLPFHKPHRIGTECYRVMRGGIEGGPTVDVLLQVWLGTESVNLSFGLPLLIRRVPPFGPVPRSMWDELRAAARALNTMTPAGRILLIGEPESFAMSFGSSLLGMQPLCAMSALLAGGMTDPPRGLSGTTIDRFACDLVSGWIGDPLLADGSLGLLNDFLGRFDVAHLLRIRVEPEPG